MVVFMCKRFAVSLLFTTSIFFLNSLSYAGGDASEDPSENLHSNVLPVRQDLSASAPLPSSAPKPVVSPLPVSQSALVVEKRPTPWRNDWERLLHLHIHNTNQLAIYQKSILERRRVQTARQMKSFLSRDPLPPLSEAHIAELELLKAKSPFHNMEMKGKEYIKLLDFYIAGEEFDEKGEKEKAEWDESRVVWHQKQLDAANKELEDSPDFVSKIMLDWDSIGKLIHTYLAYYKFTRDETEALLNSAQKYIREVAAKQLVTLLKGKRKGNG
jgi:hypothetical protein